MMGGHWNLNWGLLAIGLSLGMATVISTAIAALTLKDIKRENQTIEVKGFSEKKIMSDFATWGGTITTRAPGIAQGYVTMEHHHRIMVVFLHKQGISESEYRFSPVNTRAHFVRDTHGHATNRIDGYSINLDVEMASSDIDRITQIAENSGDLAKKGIEFSANRPQFFFTQLSNLKIMMLKQAAADARRRAEVLAREGGNHIGTLRYARQGVFQITPAHSTEVTNYGRNDTSSREKSIKAVVTLRFSIE